MDKIIVLLGASNDANGELSQMAIDRLNCAYSLYTCNNQTKFLCTGGFGDHFNTTAIPHAEYLKCWLVAKGVSDSNFLPSVISSNTKEDLQGLNEAMKGLSTELLIVVTSDFHIERVRILFDTSVCYENVIFIPAISHLNEEELHRRIAHEEQVVKLLKQQKK